MNNQSHSIPLIDYMRLVEPTDKMPVELRPVLFGLFGEVGGVMSTSKKLHREKQDYTGFRDAVVEEFGDVLWYFTAIGRRLNLPIDVVFSNLAKSVDQDFVVVASDLADKPLTMAGGVTPTPELDQALLQLGQAAAELLSLNAKNKSKSESLMCAFAGSYLNALQAAGITFGEIASHNADKTRGRFLDPVISELPTFDKAFEAEERLPAKFEIRISQRQSGKSYLQWNGVFLGDPLTDNISNQDGYRFHDVFHLAHAAVLHWSPVFRALIKHKRKSDPAIDEQQDGGRAVVVEEGLTAWIFTQAKETGFFSGRNKISFDLLKTIQQFVAGYEVEECPLKLWESAILQGYEAFLQLNRNEGGILIGNRETRTLSYQPLDDCKTPGKRL